MNNRKINDLVVMKELRKTLNKFRILNSDAISLGLKIYNDNSIDFFEVGFDSFKHAIYLRDKSVETDVETIKEDLAGDKKWMKLK